jgi:transcriptional regulator with XRE-family HTH domain
VHSFCGSVKNPQGHPCVAFLSCDLKARRPPNSKYPKQLNSLGDHIRKRRLDLALHQKQVAEKIGVDEDTIYRWESNESKPQIKFFPAIIEFLGYSPFIIANSPAVSLLLYRQLHGLSQRRLAKRVGTDPKAIGLSERGRRPLSKKLRKLLDSY